ncbi:MAG: F0F1 ATP synthase subunit epsilon [Chloroflexia bacterium]|nr:F0F1 ATP synthase subunit epsilon [Chloroflexia bacterium]MDQ3514037.1 F0F1 ATP synthase subunit epsilon [Chloroflexota bacterium]
MASVDKLTVEIVTGERIVFTEENVDMVVAPGIEGSLGILPHHAPLVTLLSEGELRITKAGHEESIVVFGGFMEVTGDRVIVLADTAERAEEIDLARAEAARQTAERSLRERGPGGVQDLAVAERAMARSAVRLRIGQRRAGRRVPTIGSGSDN